MKCQKCNQNEASFFYQEHTNTHAAKIALCHSCAAEAGLLQGQNDPFSFLFGGFPGLGVKKSTPGGNGATCPDCGATLRAVLHEGRVGCATCYRTFREQLAPSIRAMHGNATHTGRAPLKKNNATAPAAQEQAPVSTAADTATNALDALRAALKEAVACEDFEKAATLRDEIRAMEKDKES